MEKIIFDQHSFIPNGETKFCFLFGANIKHSLSPEMHSKWFLEHYQNAVYLPLEVIEGKTLLSLVKSLINTQNFIGANITLPYKNLILEDKNLIRSEIVENVSSANTLYLNSKGKWTLENTDVLGIRKSIQYLNKENKPFKVILLGGGGSAVSVIYECITNNLCRYINIFTRNPDKTISNFPFIEKQNKLTVNSLDKLNQYISKEFSTYTVDEKVILINTLPLGAENKDNLHGSYLDENTYANNILLTAKSKNISYFDLIYKDTKAVSLAKKLGINSINGELMLVTQAKESFYLWTGIKVKD
ncbi:shikimate dehydrogenase family protein [Pigmentibacter ruber]